MTSGGRNVWSCILAALVASLLAAAPVRGAAQSAFFQGKQVRFYTMGSPGGGYDAYMRALIPHLQKKLGAKMLPTNEPGAGGLIAINRNHQRASRRLDDPARRRGDLGDRAAL
jgi:tripartite-type tricarboxylate transporter receptor subunit TctC